jgi:uncharacterized protein YcnI
MRTAFVRIWLAVSLLNGFASIAQAHMSIVPNESTAGVTEKYVLRVPNEGKVLMVAAELGVPEGVIIETVAVPHGWTYDLKRQGDRIVAITWTINIPVGEFVEFGFIARNPRDKTELVWNLRQRFADGKVEDLTKGPNGIRRTAITKLAPRPAQ